MVNKTLIAELSIEDIEAESMLEAAFGTAVAGGDMEELLQENIADFSSGSILTGKIIEADEALDIGLVEKVFPHDELLDETFAYAAQVASNPYLSVRYAKDLVRMYWNHNRTDEGWAREFAAIQEITRTGDCREGIRAFLEKREPKFTGS